MDRDSTPDYLALTRETKAVAEQKLTRLKTLGRELFYDNLNLPQDLTPVPHSQDPARIPEPFRQRFVPVNLLPQLWVENNPVLQSYEMAARNTRRGKSSSDNIADIKKFYQKWLFELGKKDNEYFALSTINLVERNQNPLNFYRFIYAATVFAYDYKFRSLPRAVEYLDQAIASLNIANVDDSLKNSFHYWLRIAKGHFAFTSDDFEAAYNSYEEAIAFQQDSVTGIFYLSAAAAALGRMDEALTGIEQVIGHDLERFHTAFDKNSLELFSYALKYAFSYYIFSEPMFAGYFQEIKLLYEAHGDTTRRFIPELSKMISKLKDATFSKYVTVKINEEQSFLDKFCERFLANKNFFLVATASQLQEKYLNLHRLYQEEIKRYHMNDLYAELRSYDHMIKADEDEIQKVKDEKEKGLGILNRKNGEQVEATEKEYDTAITHYENKVADLEVSKEYDPGATFNNMMVYNVILSLVMFFVGGFVGGLADRNSMSSMSESFGALFIAGIKWAGFLFILGVIVSFVSAASKVMERSNEKRRLLKRVNALKNKKTTEVDAVKKELEKKIKLLGDITNARVTEIMNRIETRKKERSEREQELRNDAEGRIKDELEKLNACMM